MWVCRRCGKQPGSGCEHLISLPENAKLRREIRGGELKALHAERRTLTAKDERWLRSIRIVWQESASTSGG